MICLVFDDAGFGHVRPDGTGSPIPFGVYEHLLRLAKTTGTVIPVALTAKFIDTENVAGLGMANPYAADLIALLKENSDWLPVWHHGLTHMYGDAQTEFLLYRGCQSLSEADHSRHFNLASLIFRAQGLAPRVLVPPGHAWVQGLTDRIAADFDIHAIAIREFEKTSMRHWLTAPWKPYQMIWQPSAFIKSHFRLGLGIRYDESRFGRGHYTELRKYVTPSGALDRFSVHRTLGQVRQPHHYFAHVQNLMHSSGYDYFSSAIDLIRMTKEHGGQDD